MIHILLAGGGTGGHTYPLIAVARAIRRQHGATDVSLRYIGPVSPMMQREREAFTAEEIPCRFVAAGKVRRYLHYRNFFDPFLTVWGIVQSLYYLVVDMPDAVFAKGGYGAVPVVIAAAMYRIPIMTHESDAVPGVANRIIGRLAQRIAVTYQHAEPFFASRRVALVGVPVRPEVAAGTAVRARERFGLTDDKPVVTVLGGSQGARAVNKAVVEVLPLLHDRMQFVHQTGEKNFDEVVHAAARAGVKAGREGYHPVAFLDADGIGDALAVADVVVSRAGASAIAEIAAHSKPSILIPLDLSANDHQRMNAYEVARAGGAMVLEESNIGRSMLAETIDKVLSDEVLRTTMARKVHDFYHPMAADHIAQGMIELAQD